MLIAVIKSWVLLFVIKLNWIFFYFKLVGFSIFSMLIATFQCTDLHFVIIDILNSFSLNIAYLISSVINL